MKDFWNERYSQREYAYGTAPNAFFREQLEGIPPGRMLLPAEGEGRNAVYAARLGWAVVAFDYSESGKHKALALAAEHGVHIRYDVVEARGFAFPEKAFDLAGFFFAHMPSEERNWLYGQVWNALDRGGRIILEAFSTGQLEYSSGGPKHKELLLEEAELRRAMPDAEILILEETEVLLNEGPYHHGPARVVRFVGQKP